MEQLSAYLTYADAPRAVDWLGAIGFDVLARIDLPDGTIQHAELRRGDAAIMISSSDRDTAPLPSRDVPPAGTGLYLHVPDVDAVFARAIAAGARALIDPEDTDWGGRRARVLDPEGHEWSFGTYEPGSQAAARPQNAASSQAAASGPEPPAAPTAALRLVPLIHVDAVDTALPFFESLGARSVAGAPEGDFARIRFASGDELQLLGHPPNPEQDTGLVELTAVVDDLDAVQAALTEHGDEAAEPQRTGFGRQAIHRVPGGPLLKLNEFPAPAGSAARPAAPPAYYVVELTIAFPSLEAVRTAEPELLARHLENAARQHSSGHLLMAGLFLDGSGSIESMSIVDGEEAARRFLDTDPFVAAGYVEATRMRPWANMFASG